jgi:hypothetical protein
LEAKIERMGKIAMEGYAEQLLCRIAPNGSSV